MKILHTSDWHLGQKFISREREEEHRLALEWLASLIVEEKIDVLLVAGDVFDIGNPPNYARALYYGFFKKLRNTPCRHVVITAGNHDSPHMLEAPRELLQLLDIHVIGAATENPADEVLILKNEHGEPEAIVAAVPFLRDQDLRRVVTFETGQDRIERIKAGILAHYEQVGKVAEEYKKLKLPIVAMGHLYATGAAASEEQNNIYLGNLENIRADQFPEVFDYVALGHIHRAQAVGGNRHIRYSGSLIPLSFSETKDDKSVTVIEFKKNKITAIRAVEVPNFRRLKTIEGPLGYVQERLERLHEDYKNQLPVWVEVLVETETILPNLNTFLQDFVQGMNLDLLRVRLQKKHIPLSEQMPDEELEDLLPVDVFRKKCESAGKPPADVEELVLTFRELEDWVRNRDAE